MVDILKGIDLQYNISMKRCLYGTVAWKHSYTKSMHGNNLILGQVLSP